MAGGFTRSGSSGRFASATPNTKGAGQARIVGIGMAQTEKAPPTNKGEQGCDCARLRKLRKLMYSLLTIEQQCELQHLLLTEHNREREAVLDELVSDAQENGMGYALP